MSCSRSIKIPYVWTEGDTEPKLGTFTLPDGLVVSDYTITLTLEQPDGTLEVIAATDLGGSLFEFEWSAGSLLTGINQRAQLKMVRVSDGAIETPQSNILIDVQERVI